MAHTMTTSEFANYIINRFENALISKNDYCSYFSILKAGCYHVISVKETKLGISKVTINGESYSKMNASQKREALEFVNTIHFERVEIRDVTNNTLNVHNYLCGIYTQGQEIPISGTDRIWLRVERVTRIQ